MPRLNEARQRHVHYYLQLVSAWTATYDQLDSEFAQIQAGYAWLGQQTDRGAAQNLIRLIRYLTPYLQRRSLSHTLLDFCRSGLRAVEILGENPGWLWLLSYEAQWWLGEWDQAQNDALTALECTQDSDPPTYARAMLALGRLQFNRGEYQRALPTLSRAERLLEAVADQDGVMTVKAEMAAYYLNRNELDKALALYLEVDRLRRQIDPRGPTDHTLLMLGVVYRRKRNYPEAIANLSELLRRAAARNERGAQATAAHHLAWVYFDQCNFVEAERLGRRAKELYDELSDPRGSSDADEQLGLIALAQCDLTAAASYLERSLATRQQLGNQHGSASSLRRLAKLHFAQGQRLTGIHYLLQSLTLYHRLGVLSLRRALGIMKDTLTSSASNL